MAEIKIRLNTETEEVELVVDGIVASTVEKEIVASWVDTLNEKHKPVEAPVEEKIVPVVPEEVDKPDEPVVD